MQLKIIQAFQSKLTGRRNNGSKRCGRKNCNIRRIKIIIPRLDHILEQVATHLSEREAFLVAARQLVLCGGGSGLQGIKEKTEAVLGGNVRFGRPNQIKNLPNQFDSYTFLTCTGLLKYALSSFDTLPAERFDKQIQQKSRWRKVLQWLVK